MKIKNITFKSPIIAASGTYGYGDEVKSFVDLSKIGAVITKSITLNPRKGNNSPRIVESKLGMLNSIGLANIGVNRFCLDKLPLLNKINTHFIISIAGSEISDYLKAIFFPLFNRKIKHGKLFSNKNEIIVGYALAKN